MEEKAFNFSTTYLDSTKIAFWDAYKGQVPVVMDWVITWDDACNVTALTNHSSYACLSNNSHCVGSTNGRGSRCKCADGYEGNPYVKGGCIGAAPLLPRTIFLRQLSALFLKKKKKKKKFLALIYSSNILFSLQISMNATIGQIHARLLGAFVKIHRGNLPAYAHQENMKQMVFAWQFRHRCLLLPLQVFLG